MNERIKYRYWQRKDWHDPNSELEPVYCNIVDGCDPTIAVSDFEFCTGLKNKNGNLIYEHDLIKFEDDSRIFEVFWDNDNYCYSLGDVKTKDIYSLAFINHYNIEVIGNIHENKDLLEE